MNGRNQEQQRGEDAHHKVDGEEHPPVEPHRGDDSLGTPHGQERRHERGDGLDKLAKGERRREVAVAQHGLHERVERRLHQRVANAQQRERQQHDAVGVAKQRNEQRQHGHDERQHNGFLAAYLVHEHAGGHAENQEPEEHQRGKHIGLGVAQVKVCLHIVGRDTHEVNKAHAEEAQHD